MATIEDYVPEWRDQILKFQRIFSRYFPRMENDLEDAASEMNWLYVSIVHNPTSTVKKSGIDQEFKKLRKAFQTIAEHQSGYYLQSPLIEKLSENHIGAEKKVISNTNIRSDDEIEKHAKEIYDILLTVDEINGKEILQKVLDRYEEWARKAIQNSPDRRNIKWESVDAVYRLRVLWWRNTGESAPSRALNPSSLFAEYLHDAFQYLEIDADPISAFKRWAALAKTDERWR